MQDLPSSKSGLIGLLQKCRHRKDGEQASHLYRFLCEQQLQSHPVLGNYVIPMLVECGSLADAQLAFDTMRVSEIKEHSWTSLIAGYNSRSNPQHALLIYHCMKLHDCAQPSSHTYVAVLQACARLCEAWMGWKTHSEIVFRGLDSDLHVGSSLVDMYGKCGFLLEAEHVFIWLHVRDTISWTAMISAYVDHRFNENVITCLRQMQLEGMLIDPVAYTCGLKSCGSKGDLETGKHLHAQTIETRSDSEIYVGSTLLDMYIKCGSLMEAGHMFECQPFHCTGWWNALMSGYVENGSNAEVLTWFKQMQLEGISPNSVTFVCCLKTCSLSENIDAGREIHADVSKRNMEKDLFVGNALIDMYHRCMSIVESKNVFGHMQVHDVVSWNVLMAGYLEHGFDKEILICYEDMQRQGLCADINTFVYSLSACCNLGALEMGQKLHADLTRKGFETRLYVGNALVDMYGIHDLLLEACQVFDHMEVRDALSWSIWIANHAEHRDSEDVLKCFERMQLEEASVEMTVVLCVLKACCVLQAVETGLGLHAYVVRIGLEKDHCIVYALVDMYAECDWIAEAHQTYEKLPVKKLLQWKALIAAYTKCDCDGEELLNCYKQKQTEGVYMDVVIAIYCLKAYANLRLLEAGKELHIEVAKKGFEKELYVGSVLVDFYCKCGCLLEAVKLCDMLPVRDAAAWTALIAGYLDCGFADEVLKCYACSQLDDVHIDSCFLLSILKACGAIKATAKGQELHAEATKIGLERELYVGNALLDMYGRFGLHEEAMNIFTHLPNKTAVAWNTLITGYADHGLGEEVLSCSWQMLQDGVQMSGATFLCSLKACCDICDAELGRDLCKEILKRGLDGDLRLGNMLVDMYGKCGLHAEAEQLFSQLCVQDTVAWNTVMSAYSEHECFEEVLGHFEQMQLQGVPADVVTYILCLRASGSVGAIQTGREVHAEIRKIGLEKDSFVGNMLVDMYGKCGALAEACNVFDELPLQGVATWTSMIKAYGENHQGDMAIECYENMRMHGVEPDPVFFTCLLAACSHSSLIYQGREYFKMTMELLRVPTLDQRACVVDLLARSGHVYDANRFIASIQHPPSTVILVNLLSACKIYGKVALAETCFQHLVEMRRDDASSYMLMANIYVGVGRWDDARKWKK